MSVSSAADGDDDNDAAVLTERLYGILKNARITSAETVFTTAALAYERLGLTAAEVDRIKRHYAASTFPGFVTATASLTSHSARWRRITFGCAALDRLTRNGLPTRGLTELAGCAGSGKSQLCMQLALMVQLPVDMGGLGRAAVYICTEGRFASGRLYEMIATVYSLFGNRVRDIPFASRVFLEHLHDAPALLQCVRSRLPRLMAASEVGLVIVDSVAAVFRSETNDVRRRAHDMREMAGALLRMSDRYGCAVLCVNQVTSVVDDRSDGPERLVPSLGLAWANLVTTRLQLHRSDVCTVEANPTVIRSMEVVFSPELPTGRVNFTVTADGVSDVPSTEDKYK